MYVDSYLYRSILLHQIPYYICSTNDIFIAPSKNILWKNIETNFLKKLNNDIYNIVTKIYIFETVTEH